MGLSLGRITPGWHRDLACLEEANELARVAARRLSMEVFDQLPLDRKVVLLRRVSEFGLSARALNTLTRLGIIYVGDLIQLTSGSLRARPESLA